MNTHTQHIYITSIIMGALSSANYEHKTTIVSKWTSFPLNEPIGLDTVQDPQW